MSNTEHTTTSVERALSILECVAATSAGLTNSEISRRIDIPKSSASYILRTLEHRGYLRRDEENGRYRIGLKVLGLGHGALAGLDLRRVAEPVLSDLVARTALTAHLAILENRRAVYVARAENPGFIRINTWVGRDLPVHSTSVGKVLIAYLPSERLDETLERDGLAAKTPKTITSRERLLDELANIRQRGYAVDDEENNLGVRCVAAPVFGRGDQIQAALGASGPTSEVTPEAIPGLADAVKRAAASLSQQIGYGEPASNE